MSTSRSIPKLLLVGPMPTEGQYNGGIAVLLKQLTENWNLPLQLLIYNTNSLARDYGTVNRINLANLRRFLRNAFDLITLARKERPEIVYLHTSRHMAMLKDMILARLLKLCCGCAVIGHVHHATERTLLMGSSPFLRRIQVRFILSSLDSVILMCNSARTQLETMLPDRSRPAFRRKARVVYNFTELPARLDREASDAAGSVARSTGLQPALTDPSLVTETSPIRLFFIGNVGPAKGVHDLISAVAMLKRRGLQLEATLAGPFDSPAEERALKNAAKDLGVEHQIAFAGVVDGASKENLFRPADIFVLPSYHEGVPISMLEAMSYSLPVVVTNVGGIPEVLGTEAAGLIVQPGNVNELSQAIEKLALSPDLRKRMGEAGRVIVEKRHTLDNFCSDLAAICAQFSREEVSAKPGLSPLTMEGQS